MHPATYNKGLFSFLERATSPYHAVEALRALLEKAGFIALEENQQWRLQPGQPRYLIREDGSLLAFNVGARDASGFRILGCHSDSPALQIKPRPDVPEQSWRRLGVEVYGSPLLSTWFDRELSVAGRATYRGDGDNIYSTLIDFKRPVAVIPSVALHLDRKANTEKSINAQTDLFPLLGMSQEVPSPSLQDLLVQEIQTGSGRAAVQELYSFDLFLYDPRGPGYAGLNDELIMSGRMDIYRAALPAANSTMRVCR